MSTPVSVDPPPIVHLRTDSEQQRDLQAKIQRLINLQHEEQIHSSRGNDEDDVLYIDNLGGEDHRSTIFGGVVVGGAMSRRTTTEMMNLSSMVDASETKAEPAHRGVGPVAASKAPWPSEAPVFEGLPSQSLQQGVGRGTMIFSSTYSSSRRGSSADQGMIAVPMNSQRDMPPLQQQPFPPHQIFAGYGALEGTANQPQRDNTYQDNERQVELQQHEFHYGNPDYHNPYEDDRDKRRQRYRPENSICAKLCCLYVPIANLLMQENVQRSFCYGSIDGMLTGSGIVSAFGALDVLSPYSRWEVRIAVVVFTVAACVADAICMAIGHVWTSFVVSSSHAQERSRQRRMLDGNKADAKARLVDMLLARGMLKIDAMSLADTLEGYPDMFVSVLVGDSILAGSDLGDDETDDGQQQQQQQHLSLLPTTARGSLDSLGFGDNWKFPSYGQFNEMEHEPETNTMNLVLKESQVEGFFMMLGFAMFAVIPSLLWLLLPSVVLPNAVPAAIVGAMAASSSEGSESLSSSSSSPSSGTAISLPSLVVSICGLIIWSLGVWKSKFMDSNWVMSGIENVVVLLACVLSAYGVGFGLCYAIGGTEGVTITNIVR